MVLFPALDRLARSIEVQAVPFSEFRRLGLRVEFVTMQTEDTKEFRALLNFLGTIAEYEREAIRDRTLNGKRRKASLGLVVAPRNPPYGYEPDSEHPGKLRICEREAEVVRLIYSLCVDEGKSIVKGFIVSDRMARLPDFLKDCGGWLRDGRLKHREDVVVGLEKAPEAFIGLLPGKNFGKLLVRVGEDPTK